MSSPTDRTITAEDVAVLKAAAKAKYSRTVRRYARVEAIVVYAGARVSHIEGRINVCAQHDNGGFDEQVVYANAAVRNYGGDRRAAGRYVATNDHTPFTEEEATLLTNLANVVRKGDVLTVKFTLANNTKSAETLGADFDSCVVSIYRKGVLFATLPVDTRLFTSPADFSFSDYRYAAPATVSA